MPPSSYAHKMDELILRKHQVDNQALIYIRKCGSTLYVGMAHIAPPATKIH